ncbi:MAG TPA: four helix bundle protein [Thermoanaerobaculia bacterium]|nr:four helix bundle protein [Thermoanaerobaculia bacterium]
MTYYRDVHAWQMRASVSIPSNIAEGYGRWSRREHVHFLYIARGSLLELETQLFIAFDLEYLRPAQFDDLLRTTEAIGRKLNGLIRYYKHNGSPEPRPPTPEP